MHSGSGFGRNVSLGTPGSATNLIVYTCTVLYCTVHVCYSIREESTCINVNADNESQNIIVCMCVFYLVNVAQTDTQYM